MWEKQMQADADRSEVLAAGAFELCGAQWYTIWSNLSNKGWQADAQDLYLRGDEAGLRGGEDHRWKRKSKVLEKAVFIN